MSKQTGLGDNFFVAGVDLSGDTRELGKVGGGNEPIETTGINKSAKERLGGHRDGGIDWTSYYNPAASAAAHATLKGLPTADVIVTYCRGTSLGSPAACCVAKQLNYDGSRDNSGEFTLEVSSVANAYGLEWGDQLTAGKRTDTAATNGTGLDTTASLSFGAQAYLHVFTGFTGTSVTVKVQDSADNVTFADITGLTFTAATGVTSERLATTNTATIRRYVRAITTGTFSSATFSVVLVKNQIAGQVF
jgi:hypothetical protein